MRNERANAVYVRTHTHSTYEVSRKMLLNILKYNVHYYIYLFRFLFFTRLKIS